MRELPKSVRRAVREAADLAYQRELEDALEDLAESFAEWKAGKINAFDLSDAIHEFHQGPSRQLFSRYSDSSMLDVLVAGAVHAGFIKVEEIGDAARGHISKLAERLKALAAEK